MHKNLVVFIILFFLFCSDVYAVTIPSSSVSTFSPEQRSEKTESLWLRPYVSFETIELENKNKVKNNGYGTYIGYDTKIINLSNDWDSVLTFHIGYTGSKQKYKKRKIYQEGGQLGISGVFFRDKFFIGIGATVGATGSEISTPIERENFSMLNSTAALKVGYNFEFLDEKIVLQSSFLGAYLFVNTFDYVNSYNVRIKSEPVHSIQLVPGMKVTCNLRDGWQPYFGVQAIWNIMNESNFSPNDVSVGDISVDPYIQYGIGVQKSAGEKYSTFVQSTFRNGGRNGIVLSLGIRRYF